MTCRCFRNQVSSDVTATIKLVALSTRRRAKLRFVGIVVGREWPPFTLRITYSLEITTSDGRTARSRETPRAIVNSRRFYLFMSLSFMCSI